jgi:hypothetical protein
MQKSVIASVRSSADTAPRVLHSCARKWFEVRALILVQVSIERDCHRKQFRVLLQTPARRWLLIAKFALPAFL